MNERALEEHYDAVATLARSLFGFALVAWLPLLITWLLLLFARPSSAETYAQLQRTIVAGFAAATFLGLAGTVWIYRLDAATAIRLSRRVSAVFGNPWLALALVLLLVEANILSRIMTRDIAPSLTNPAMLLLLCWTLVFIGLLLTVHWRTVKSTCMRGRNLWAFVGVSTSAIILLTILVVLSSRLVTETRIHERLRGSLDYRPLRFLGDGSSPTAQQFWTEQGQTRVRWLPLSYWTVEPIDGEFINVDDAGLRRTIPVSEDPDAPRVYFFGGSTMWGEGARDAYTIPSQVAQLLADREIPAMVQNYAQTGYVSSQDLILFQAQLALGNLPDLAVFYQGFNDVYSTRTQGMTGIPMGESRRVSDVEAGRLLRQGQPVLRPLDSDVEQIDWSLVTISSASAQEIADRWLGNRRLIRAVAKEYGVKVLFVWQPTLFAKQQLTDFESLARAEIERALPGFVELYRAVDSLLDAQMLSAATDDVIMLTNLFSEYEDEIFFDEVHVNEIGNEQIADILLGPIADRLGGN